MASSTSSLKYSSADSCRTTLIDNVLTPQSPQAIARRVPMSSADFARNYTIICTCFVLYAAFGARSAEHTSELQSHSDLHSFPTRRSSDLSPQAIARRVPMSSADFARNYTIICTCFVLYAAFGA